MRMKMERYIPDVSLRPFIKSYVILESGEDRINRLLPDTSLALAFRYRGVVKQVTGHAADTFPRAVISGLRTSARLINYMPDSGNIVVLFREGGAAAFFREPLHRLFEASIPLDAIIKPLNVAMVEEQLAGARNDCERIMIVERFLLSNLRHLKPDQLILAAVEKIHSEKGLLKMRELADMFCISPDAFEKRFRKAVGSSPKQFASVVRMRSVINRRSSGLLDMAFDAGFYDQSHFNKSFRQFTGQSPTDFFKSPFW